MRDFQNFDVMEKFFKFKGERGVKLMQLRELIFDTAESDSRIGSLSEELRWGDPSYLTASTGAGSTVRLGVSGEDRIAIFFNCKTTLVEMFREMHGDQLEYSKNRAVVIDPENMPNDAILEKCIHMSLTYKLKSSCYSREEKVAKGK